MYIGESNNNKLKTTEEYGSKTLTFLHGVKTIFISAAYDQNKTRG